MAGYVITIYIKDNRIITKVNESMSKIVQNSPKSILSFPHGATHLCENIL